MRRYFQTLPTARRDKVSNDVLGREVATLVNEVKEVGSYSAKLDGSKLSRQNAGGLASGIYFYTLQSGNFTATKKLSLLK